MLGMSENQRTEKLRKKITVAQPVDCPDPCVIVLQRKERKLGKTQGERSCFKDKILTADLQINWQGSTLAQIPYTQVLQEKSSQVHAVIV